jgi:flagellar FliL protein
MSVTEMMSPELEEETPRKGKKILLLGLVGLVAVIAAAWWFMIRPAGAAEPTPGEVMQLESIQVNLEGGHYLKIGIALQAVEGAEHVEGSKALDATIELFTGRTMEELANPKKRELLQAKLADELDHRYHGEVMEVYFTDFVTQ